MQILRRSYPLSESRPQSQTSEKSALSLISRKTSMDLFMMHFTEDFFSLFSNSFHSEALQRYKGAILFILVYRARCGL